MAVKPNAASSLVSIESVYRVQAVALLAEALITVGHFKHEFSLVIIANAVALAKFPLLLQSRIAA